MAQQMWPDYTATNSTLTFNPSEVSKTFTVGILADSIHEHNETFIVTLWPNE